jgi:DNA-binding transcriptional LysR family regulator
VDPIKLQRFLAVLDTGHFARAAAQLGISQPAVSKSIKTLETELGVRLFERGQFGAEPTPFAKRLAVRAKLILAEGRLARAELDAMRGAKSGSLAIGTGISFASRILPQALDRFRRRWPNVAISVDVGISGMLFPGLLRGDYDFVISAPPPSLGIDPEIACEALFEEADVLVVGPSHPLLVEPPRTIADVQRYPWLVAGRSGLWESIVASFTAVGSPPPRDVIRTDSDTLAKALLLQGPYVCLLGRQLFAVEADQQRLFEVSLPGFGDRRPAFITTRRRSQPSLAARNMLTLIRAICAELDDDNR